MQRPLFQEYIVLSTDISLGHLLSRILANIFNYNTTQYFSLSVCLAELETLDQSFLILFRISPILGIIF